MKFAVAAAESTSHFARHLGVAYQILNDLDDWQPRDDNRPTAGGDVLDGRPTLLAALALETLDEPCRGELLSLLDNPQSNPQVLQQVDRLYRQAGVYETARVLVDKHHRRAREVADSLQPDSLRRLLHYLADNLLE